MKYIGPLEDDEIDLNESLRDWYREKEGGDEKLIKEGSTFLDLFNALKNYEAVEVVIGNHSNRIREACFLGLAMKLGIPTEYVYLQWRLGTTAEENPFIAK